MRVFISLFICCMLLGSLNCIAQPSKSYKKQMKTKEKSAKHAESFAAEQEQSAEKLKKYKKKLGGLDREKQDAQASGDIAEMDKVELKIRETKGEMRNEKDKIEDDIVKGYNKMQEKEVRKRMKKNKKKSKRINSNKRTPFFKRIFS